MTAHKVTYKMMLVTTHQSMLCPHISNYDAHKIFKNGPHSSLWRLVKPSPGFTLQCCGTHHADFLRLFVLLFGVRHRTTSHQRIETEQKQHVQEQQTNNTDDEDNNHLSITHRPHTWITAAQLKEIHNVKQPAAMLNDAKTPRPTPRPKLWGQGQGWGQNHEAKSSRTRQRPHVDISDQYHTWQQCQQYITDFLLPHYTA